MPYLEQVQSSQTKRLLINIPPRSLKSTIVSVAWPAWVLGNDPSKKIIVASYSLGLSEKHSQECRDVMSSEWYKELFPNSVIRKGSNKKAKFITTKKGFRFATSINGTLTGEGADYLMWIIHIPHCKPIAS